MAWLATDRNGDEYIFTERPVIYREIPYHGEYWQSASGVSIPLPKGCIEKLLGRPLSWKDEAIEI